MGDLISKFISRHTFTLAIINTIIILFSLSSWFAIPIEVMPKENTPAFLFIRINANEKSLPEQIEKNLTRPVENALKSLTHLNEFSSSTDANGAGFSLYFDANTNLDEITLEGQEIFQELESLGILQTKNLSFSRLNPDATAVIKFAIDDSRIAKSEISHELEKIQDQIESWPEVSKVEISGHQKAVYEISVDHERLTAQGLSPRLLKTGLSSNALRENLGDLQEKNSLYRVSIVAKTSLPAIEKFIQTPLSNKNPTPLKAISKIHLFDKSKDEWNHKDGKTAVFFEIFPKDKANLFNLNERYLELKSGLNQSHIQTEGIFNQVSEIDDALKDVIGSLYQAIVITFLIVFVFYRDLRRTVLVCTSIPLTLLMTVAMMYLAGQSLNILSLSGLILGIGMVVDNSILFVENSDELQLSLGKIPGSAQAAQTVMLPLTLSTITNAIIFLPVAFVQGGDSFTDLLKSLQVPILSSLLASMIVALVVLPLATILWPTKLQAHQVETDPLEENSRSFFSWTLRNKVAVLAVVIFATVSMGKWVFEMDQSDLETAPDPFISVVIRFTPELSIEQKKQIYKSFDQDFNRKKDELGYEFILSQFSPSMNSGGWTVFPQKNGNRDEQLAQLKSRLEAYLEKNDSPIGSHLSLGWDSWGVAKSKKSISIQLSGPESEQLGHLIDEIKNAVLTLEGVASAYTDQELQGKGELFFGSMNSFASSKQIKNESAAQALGSLLSPASFDLLNEQKAQIRILDGGLNSWSLSSISNLSFLDERQVLFSLRDFTGPHEKSVTSGISRKLGLSKQRLNIYLANNLNVEEHQALSQKIRATIAKIQFPFGYGPPQDDSSLKIQAMQKKTNFILTLSAFLIFVTLASLFESVFAPIPIMLSVPIALIFGAGGLIPFGYDLDVMARLALVILIGACVNNAIIIIDLIRSLKKQGTPIREALLAGCSKRLRAVIMTTAIQILSVLPVALGQSKIMGIPYASLGIVMIFGMLFSTIVTLVILPLTYEIFDRIESLWQ